MTKEDGLDLREFLLDPGKTLSCLYLACQKRRLVLDQKSDRCCTLTRPPLDFVFISDLRVDKQKPISCYHGDDVSPVQQFQGGVLPCVPQSGRYRL